jgi:hypothetical protein
MPRKSELKSDDPEQSKRFEEVAREIGADADAETFDRAFGVVAKSTVPPPKPKTRRALSGAATASRKS